MFTGIAFQPRGSKNCPTRSSFTRCNSSRFKIVLKQQICENKAQVNDIFVSAATNETRKLAGSASLFILVIVSELMLIKLAQNYVKSMFIIINLSASDTTTNGESLFN